MSLLPFASKPKVKIVPVGNDEIGIVHLKKIDAITPKENTADFQADTRKAVRIQKIVNSVCEKMSAELGITKAEARKRLFNMPIKSAAVENEAPVEVVDEEESTAMGIYEWMTPEQVDEFISGQGNQEEIAIKAVTLLIQNRIAYPVTVVANAKDKATELFIETGLEEIEQQSKIRFGNITVTVDGYSGGDTLETLPLSSKLAAGSVGYLLDERGREKLGAPEWTIDDTRNLPTPLIAEIYRFYQVEAGLIGDTVDGEDEGELMGQPSIESSSSPLSNGAKSIGDSNILDVLTSA
jgi:hypothetical protein